MTPPSAAPTALERCVGDACHFIEQVWSRVPLYRRAADPTAFADLIDLDDVDHLIAEAGLRFPALRVVKGGSKLLPAAFTRSGKVGGLTVPDLVDPAAVYEQFASGATVVLTSLHRHWPALTQFCRELELELTHPVQVNLYLTPPEAQGLDLHYDTHDVFVLHLHGEKSWQVFERAVEAPLAHQHGRVDPERPGERLLAETLAPGDALYVPRGFVHAAVTERLASAHLTVGILAYTWVDLLRALVHEAEGEPAMRAALSPGFASRSRRELGAEVETMLGRLAAWVREADPETLADGLQRRFWDSRRPALRGQLQRLLALDEVADDTWVRRRPEVPLRVTPPDTGIALELPDRTIHVPEQAAPAVTHLLEGDGHRVVELKRWLDADGRRVLVRRLIREGVLEQVERE